MFLFKILTPHEKFLFIVVWIIIIFLLGFGFYKNYLHLPEIVEGFDHEPKTFNPLLAKNDIENSIASLIFRSILKPDGHGGFVYDLAKKIIFNSSTKEYLIELREAFWQDGSRLTSDDVVFTFKAAKLVPDTPYFLAFKDIEIEKVDYNSLKIKINLPCSLEEKNFILPYLTLGILPQKIFSSLNFDSWLASPYNFQPLTSGPFKIKKIIKQNGRFQQIILVQDPLLISYFPYKIKYRQIVFKIFNDRSEVIKNFWLKKINSFLIDDPHLISEPSFPLVSTHLILPTYFALWTHNSFLKSILANFNWQELSSQFFNLQPINFLDERYLSIFNLHLSLKEKITVEKSLSEKIAQDKFTIIIPENKILSRIFLEVKQKVNKNVNLNIAKLDLKTFQEKILTDNNFLKEQNFVFSEKYEIYPQFNFLKYQATRLNNWELVKLIDNIRCQGLNENNLTALIKILNNGPYVFLFNLDWLWIGQKNKPLILNNLWERFSAIIYN